MDKIKQNWLKFLNIFTIIAILFVCLISGYYLGYNNGLNKGKGISNTVLNNIKNDETVQKEKISEIKPEFKTLEGIIFLKPNIVPRVCPETHPIKGIYANDLGYFYTKDNKNYEKIKPDICFVNRDTAINIAGFIQKI